jgi:L-cysteine S-thiosulfotransferase
MKGMLMTAPLLLAACVDKADLPKAVAQGDPRQGLAVIRQSGCSVCHTVPGVAWPRGRSAGDLAGFGAKPLIAGRLPNQPEVLMQWLIDAPALDPDTAMPSFALTQDQARHVAAYLYTLDDQ